LCVRVTPGADQVSEPIGRRFNNRKLEPKFLRVPSKCR
jgi:hypothetical protein